MLHPLFLNFKDEKIESEYRESQKIQIKEDFQAISLIIMLVGSAIIILIVFLEQYQIAFFGSIGLIIIPLFRYMVEQNPDYVNFIYPILQITISLILNGLIKYLPETLLIYNWYFGLLAGVLHLGLLMQGTVLCYQSWTLIGLFIWHIYNIGFSTQINSLMCLSMAFILVVLIYIRRSYQRNNRTFYLEFRENFKWFSIVDKIVKTKIALISFDKKQDQIQLVQATQQFYANHEFMTQKEFRNYMRAIKVKQLNLKEQTLETIIRQMLIKKEKYKSTTQILQDKLYYIYTGYSKIHSSQYKIQLIDYYQADKKMVIAIFSDIKVKCPNQQKQNIFQRNYLKYLALEGLQSYRLLLQSKTLSARKYLIPYLQFYITNIWLNPNISINKTLIAKINFTEINILLQKIYQCPKIKLYQPQCIMFNSQNAIWIIFVTLFELFQQTKQTFNICEIKSKSKFNLLYWKVIFKFNKLQLNENIVQYCKTNVHFDGFQYFQFKTDVDIEQNIKKIANHMSYVSELFQIQDQRSIYLSLGLPIVKFLLQHYGLTNKIKIKGNSISFTLINFHKLPNKI